MIKLLKKVPQKIILACSGGVDSMAALDFLNNGKREIVVVNVNHLTEFGNLANKFVEDYCKSNNLKFISRDINPDKPKEYSLEEYWRIERYKIFEEIHNIYGFPVVTVHHLNDAVETWVFSSINGNPKLIPHERDYFIRPFLLTPKKNLQNWVKRKNVPFLEDQSNLNTKFVRNRIRRNIIPEILKINPGIEKVIKKKILEVYCK